MKSSLIKIENIDDNNNNQSDFENYDYSNNYNCLKPKYNIDSISTNINDNDNDNESDKSNKSSNDTYTNEYRK